MPVSALAETPVFGTTVAYAGTDYTSPTTIGKVIDLTTPKTEVESVDTSNFATAAQVKTSQPGWVKPGKAKITVNWDHTLVNVLEGFITNKTVKGWIVTYNDGTAIGGTTASTRKFNGYIVSKGEALPMDKIVTYEIEVQQTGAETFTPGT